MAVKMVVLHVILSNILSHSENAFILILLDLHPQVVDEQVKLYLGHWFYFDFLFYVICLASNLTAVSLKRFI